MGEEHASVASSLVPRFILERHAAGERTGELGAAALFADVSGFTALTEALQSRGKEGAEALARALAFYFDPLIDAVHDRGGIITGIAGDGISAIYPEEPHGPGLAGALAS